MSILKILIGIVHIQNSSLIWIDFKNNNYDNKTDIKNLISRVSQRYGVDEKLVNALVNQESGFNPNAKSKVGAMGLMQMMPSTFKDITENFLYENLDVGMLYDPETNIRYGTYMLSYLYTQHNRWKTVLAIYDAGRETVENWLENEAYIDENGNLSSVPDASTAAFVEKIEKEMEMYRKLYYID